MNPDHEPEQPRSLRERQRAAIRSDLRRAAYRLFAEHGYDTVSVDDIAAAAGLSRRTLFRHVSTKEELLLGPVRNGGAAIARILEDQVVGLSAAEALKEAIVARAAAFEDDESQQWLAAVSSAPGLLDKVTMVTAADRDRILKIIAAQMETDTSDLIPGLLIHLAFAAGDYGFQRWIHDAGRSGRPLRDWVTEALDTTINPPWTTTPSTTHRPQGSRQ
ncbi:TetR/AcrR family transcriptional regulator [Mycobacterium sp. pUA109]|uniref:TetR/AcrR family transcriptional regulator n=1 Tax=Mycobacterium sp. pUA109 TaxID=3238982 RepID=UPI00351B351F